MKTLNELYNEVIASDALKNEFLELKTPEDIVAFARKYGCDATLDDIKTFFEEKQKAAGELSEAELEQVAGGKDPIQFATDIGGSCSSYGLSCIIKLTISVVRDRMKGEVEKEGLFC